MSGIYIKNLDIPTKKKGVITINIYYNGEVYCYDNEDIQKAIPVPDHGRLIDADAIVRKCKDEKGGYYSYESAVIGEAVDSASTIIPSDKGGEKDG